MNMIKKERRCSDTTRRDATRRDGPLVVLRFREMARRLPAKVGVQAWRIRVTLVRGLLFRKLFSARRAQSLSTAAQAQAQKVRSTAAALRIYA
jgi:hypothetical protein